MRLALKITAAVVVGLLLVLAVHGYWNAHRELAFALEEKRRDEHALGRALVATIASVWQSEGSARALERVRETDELKSDLRIRWVSLDASPRAPDAPDVEGDALAPVAAGVEVARTATDADGNERVYTYVPVRVEGRVVGAIELSKSMELVRASVRRAVRDTTVTTLAVAGLGIAIASGLGITLIGVPVRRLTEHARRIGAGDLSRRLEVSRRDELGVLAVEMNAMCDHLVEARERLLRETAERVAALEQMRHADRLATVGTLASGVAHELGTPLNVVAGRAKMIESGQTSGERVAENARIIGEQTKRMTAIIRQLLDFARRRVPRRAATDLTAVVRQTCALLRPLADEARVELRVAADEALVTAEIDRGQIEQALVNVVVNAIQAMPRGGDVSLRACPERARPPGGQEPEAEYARLDVRDRGEGIAQENLSCIFEPFFTTKEVGQGTGLGLSVAHGIVRDHGGWIAVESKVGEGSCFSIYLPLEANRCRSES